MDKTVTVDVDADTAAAEAKIDALSRDRKVELKVDVDKGAGALTGSLGGLASTAADVGTQAGGAFVKSAASGVRPNRCCLARTWLTLLAPLYCCLLELRRAFVALLKTSAYRGWAVALRRRFAGGPTIDAVTL
jgi:hypothetical protein